MYAFHTLNAMRSVLYLNLLREHKDKTHEEILAEIDRITRAPVPVYINCPKCDAPHIDEGEWATRPHKTHQCQQCKHEWRPFEYPTVGVSVGVDIYRDAIEAIVARFNGEYDNPALISFGPLATIEEDVHRIAEDTLKMRSTEGTAPSGKSLLHSIAESARCLGVAQQKGDEAAMAYWSDKVDKLIAGQRTKEKTPVFSGCALFENMTPCRECVEVGYCIGAKEKVQPAEKMQDPYLRVFGVSSESDQEQPAYTFDHNHCDCHPETCCCNAWAVFDSSGNKHSTYKTQALAKEVSEALSVRKSSRIEPLDGGIDYSLKSGDVVFKRSWCGGTGPLEIVDVNWALRAVAVRLPVGGSILVWPVEGCRREPYEETQKNAKGQA